MKKSLSEQKEPVKNDTANANLVSAPQDQKQAVKVEPEPKKDKAIATATVSGPNDQPSNQTKSAVNNTQAAQPKPEATPAADDKKVEEAKKQLAALKE